MANDLWILAGLTVVGAVFLVMHASVVWHIFHSSHVSYTRRLVSVFPPMTGLIAWRAGLRRPAVLWTLLLLCYVLLRLQTI